MGNLLSRIKIGYRLMVGSALVLLLALAIILPVVYDKLGDLTGQAERRQLDGLYAALVSAIESEGSKAVTMSAALAAVPGVAEALAGRDREHLAALSRPMFEALKDRYLLRQLQFHLPPAMSFYRAHQPAKFDDDLSSFRLTVVETNRSGQPMAGLERGVAGLGLRGVAPVRLDGRHIGSVEYGFDFGQGFFDTFKARYGVDAALHVRTDEGFRAFATTIDGGTLLGQSDLQKALAGESLLLQSTLGGHPVSVLVRVVNDFAGNPAGVVELVVDRSEYVAAQTQALATIFGIGVLALVLGLLVSVATARGITAAAVPDGAQAGGHRPR